MDPPAFLQGSYKDDADCGAALICDGDRMDLRSRHHSSYFYPLMYDRICKFDEMALNCV